MPGGDLLFKIAIVAVLVALAWFWLRPRFDIRIVADSRGLVSHQGVAEAHLPDLQEFFTRDVELTSAVKVQGQRLSGGQLRLRIQGPCDAGTKQRIRNFLITLL